MMENFDFNSVMIDDGDPMGTLSSDILDIINKTNENEGVENRDEYIAHFNESIDKRGKNKLSHLVADGQVIYLLKADIPSGGMVGIQVFMLLEKISDDGEVFGTLPDGDNVSNGKFDDGIILLLTHKNPQFFEEVFQEVFNVSPVYDEVAPEELGLEEVESKGLASLSGNDKMDSLLTKVEDLMLSENSVTIGSGANNETGNQIDEIKVKVDDMNKLFKLIEELVLVRNQFIRITETQNYASIKEINSTLDRTTNDLYMGILKLRMVSVGQIFNHLKQLVSKLATEQSKFVDFIIRGEDVSVDRKILEELVDPMKALIVNAITNGIEVPEERLKAGKHRVGTLTLNALNEGETIKLILEDNGRGISPEKVKETAISLGLTSKKIVDGMSGDEVFDLLTLPGFTTQDDFDSQDTVMGLNAVKLRIESNGGSLDLKGIEDVGFTSTVILPTNMAIMRVLIFSSSDQIFTIPSTSIKTILHMDNVTIDSKLQNIPLIQYQKNIIPAHNLGKTLGLQQMDDKFGIVVQKRNKYLCVVVSKVLGFEDVVVKSVEDNIINYPWIEGTTVLSNGKAVPIIDLWSLIRR